LVRTLVLEADEAVKEGSPVDLGTFAVSWQIGENGDLSGEPAEKKKYSNTSPPPKGSNYTAGKEKAGKVYSIHNNLPYAEPLCFQGHSDQVDPNWFVMLAKDMGDRADDLWNHIQRKP
jgi:hypothetical protein